MQRGARRPPRRPAGDRGGGLPLRVPAQGRRRPCCGRWAPTTASPWRAWPLVVAWTVPTRRRPPPSATRWSRATSTGRAPCSVGTTRCAASSPTATSAGASSASPRRTCPCPARCCCPPTGSTRGGSSGPTAPCWPAALSLGRRPTFYAEAHVSLLEAHLLDFSGNLYDEARPGALRGPAPRRGEVRLDRGAGRADPAGLRRRPEDPASSADRLGRLDHS